MEKDEKSWENKEYIITRPEFWYEMELGQIYYGNPGQIITRVPGGWLFHEMKMTTFIPFNNEFQKIK